MEKKKANELETLNINAYTSVFGYDRSSNKFGMVPFDQIMTNTAWFGRRWKKSNASPVGEEIGNLEMGRNLAKQLGLGGYLVKNDHSRTKLSAENHRYLENGSAADLSGGAGHYQWGWNVPFYYQCYEDDVYDYETISISGPRPGFWNYRIPVGSRSCAGYATIDRTTGTLVSYVNSDARYRGGNNNSALDSAYNSQLGMPATNMTIDAFRTAARKNGTLWFANEHAMHYVTCALKRIIFGNRNIQAPFTDTLNSNGLRQGGTGQGADYFDGWDKNFSYYPYIPLSTGVEKGDFTGLSSCTINNNGSSLTIGNIPSFYGLKNDYKYLSAMSENMLLRNNSDGSQTMFIPKNVDGSLMNLEDVTGLKEIGRGPASSSAGWLYPKEMTFKNLAFMPKTVGASESTYYSDGYYNPAATSGLRGVVLLGLADNGGLAGSLCLGGIAGVWGAYALWGAFLCEWAEAFTTEPVWCAEG